MAFNIEGGAKQGDTLSSLLLNGVSESLMRKLKYKWQNKRHGIQLQPHGGERLTNLRFADDILLTSTSLPSLTNMIADLNDEASKIGLQLHPDKTKILHNHHNQPRRIPTRGVANGLTIQILSVQEHTKYLGRKLSFSDPHRTEVENRISFAWKKFFSLKQELTGYKYSLSDRLRLFHGTVTPTILYSCEAWTLTTELENRLRRTQRQMLRMILHSPRRKEHNDNHLVHNPETQTTRPHMTTQTATEDNNSDSDVDSETQTTQHATQPDAENHDTSIDLEPWVDWIRRCTHDAETRMKNLKLDDWVTMQRRRKWRWAHKLANATVDTWATTTLLWDPRQHTEHHPRRQTGRPKLRWTDDINSYLRQSHHNSYNAQVDEPRINNDYLWMETAKDTKLWSQLEENYVSGSRGMT